MIAYRASSVAAAVLLLSALCGARENVPSAWSTQGEVRPQRVGISEVTVPRDLLDQAAPTLHDLRLFRASGEEIPYSLHQPSRLPARWVKTNAFKSVIGDRSTALTANGPADTVDAIRLDSPAREFLKSVSLDVFKKGRWQTLWTGRPIFRTSPGVQNLEVDFPARTLSRFRIRVDDQNSDPIPFTGIAIREASDSVPPIERLPAILSGREDRPWETRFTFALPSQNLFVDGLAIETADPMFQRSVRVVLQQLSREEHGGSQQIIEVPLGGSILYRAPGDNGKISENLFVPINRRIPSREIHLIVENRDAPPLEIKSATVHQIPTRLFFYSTDLLPVTLAGGHLGAPAPRYDWPFTRTIPVPARVGPIVKNPDYVKPDVAPLLPSVGAAFEDKGWGYRAPVAIQTSGVHSLEIPFSILVHGSPDGRDVRLVRNGQHIPFVYDRRGSPQPIVPELTPDLTAPKGISRWPLNLPLKGIPISQLEVWAKDPLFQRPVHIYENRFTPNGQPYRHAFANTRWRRDEKGGDRLVVSFAGLPQNDRLYFEVEDGDNAPLSLVGVRLYYQTFAMVFKTDPGEPLWVYYGRPETRFPIYDATLVADELLTAEKSKAVLGSEEKIKPRWVWGTSRTGETSILFWAVLGAVTLVLLLVIQRLLPTTKRKP